MAFKNTQYSESFFPKCRDGADDKYKLPSIRDLMSLVTATLYAEFPSALINLTPAPCCSNANTISCIHQTTDWQFNNDRHMNQWKAVRIVIINDAKMSKYKQNAVKHVRISFTQFTQDNTSQEAKKL